MEAWGWWGEEKKRKVQKPIHQLLLFPKLVNYSTAAGSNAEQPTSIWKTGGKRKKSGKKVSALNVLLLTES